MLSRGGVHVVQRGGGGGGRGHLQDISSRTVVSLILTKRSIYMPASVLTDPWCTCCL